MRKWILVYPTNLVSISVIAGVLFIVTDGVLSSHVKDASGVLFKAPRVAGVCFILFFVASLVGTAVSLIRRNWVSSLCYFAAACIAQASSYAALAVKGDRFTFTAGSHRDIADIYDQRRADLDAAALQAPRLVALDEQCHPPAGCQCWILMDPARASGAEKESAGWHRPTAPVFPTDTLPRHFAIVNVRRIDANAYSVLGCSADWSAWVPL